MEWKFLSGSLLWAASIACAHPVPAPPFTTPMDRVPAESIQAYLPKLKFDYRDGAGDVQHLLVNCEQSCQLGPLVGIFPEQRIQGNKTSHLAEGAGRIIAQIINYDKKNGYPELNLGPGDTVYWAVDSVVRVNRDMSRGRSLFISAQAMSTRRDSFATKRVLRLFEHPDSVIKTSAARWVLDSLNYDEKGAPGGEGEGLIRWMRTMTTWANCKSGGCCRN